MRRLLLFTAIALPVLAAAPASAQAVFGRSIAEHASLSAGRVDGVVTDQSGATVGGVSVVALGNALAMARTDLSGRFSLSLPPGQYVLRATREGYLSTYREAVRIQSDVALRRTIMIVRSADHAEGQSAPIQGTDAVEARPNHGGDHAHTETAWRLRHLDRTVLRDGTWTGDTGGEAAANQFSRDVTPVDWILASSTRAATSFFGGTDFNGQVNLLATSALSASGMAAPELWGRGVAYVVLGAPIGSSGDWLVRAALAPGEAASWNVQGEYQARENRDHVFRTGMSYGIQPDASRTTARASMALPEGSRRVGGVYAFDVWTLHPGLTVDYGARVERYDYLDAPTLLSGRLGMRADLGRRIAVVADAAPHMVAPGAAEFLPPERSGAWLPPERTFSSFGSGPFKPERIDHYGLGVDAVLFDGTTITVRRFSEASRDQIATVFGLGEATDVGHYYVATSGTVELQGLAVGLNTRVSDFVHAELIYTRTDADWNESHGRRRLARVAPSLARAGRERGHDLTTTVDATMPATATRVSLVYRLNNLFSGPSSTSAAGMTDGRFSFDVRQQLPYRPLGRGEFTILISARTLLRDSTRDGAFYDELMTFAPPMQVACGIQMRF